MLPTISKILLGTHGTVNRRVPLLHAPRGANFCGHGDNVAFFPRNFSRRHDKFWVGIRTLKAFHRHELSCPSYNPTFMVLFSIRRSNNNSLILQKNRSASDLHFCDAPQEAAALITLGPAFFSCDQL